MKINSKAETASANVIRMTGNSGWNSWNWKTRN